MSCHPFDLLMELNTDLIHLDCAVLHLARDFYPQVSVATYLRRLDALAERVAELRPGLSAPWRYQALRRVLVDETGLRGAEASYFALDASLLNRVLDTRRGTPLGLALVWVEVGRRLKWPVAAVDVPGSFLVRIDDEERFVLADPFQDGLSLSVDDCQQLVDIVFDGRVPFSFDFLRPMGNRDMLMRVLRHLCDIFVARNDLARAAESLRRMAAVEPANAKHLQDLAAVCCRQGDVRGACAHLQLYLRRAPDAHDSKLVRRNLRQLQAALLALN